ncbi:MAG: transglutaminase family protein [Candidatus Omnitrophica bacterium]|nr:transglutaminase family protein [Candidatus Omnitrophota bacterium]
MSVENKQIPDPKQLPYLLNLLDDESAAVRTEIVRHLVSFGPQLKSELAKLPQDMVQSRVMPLEKIMLELDREALVQKWPTWQNATLDLEKLEVALSFLADFQSGLRLQYQTREIGPLLDQLAAEYLAYAKTNDPLELAKFLFEVKGFNGAKTDYYNPQSSNMLYVLHEKKGLPISLSCLYMLVGARAGFVIDGYNTPGHFMAKVDLNGKVFVVDGFNNGKVVEEQDALKNTEPPGVSPAPVSARDIIRRVLNNLINAYQAQGESGHQQLMIDLYRMIQED